MSESELQRIVDRAGLASAPTGLHPLAYRGRHGDVHLPLEATVELARAFAAAEPATVVGDLDDQEEVMRLRGNTPGERWWHSYLREKAPGFAIARHWAGLEQEAEMLRKEIAGLRSHAHASWPKRMTTSCRFPDCAKASSSRPSESASVHSSAESIAAAISADRPR